MRTKIGGSVFTRLQRVSRVGAVGLLTVAALALTACTGNGPVTSQDDVKTINSKISTAIDAAVDNALKLSGSTEAVVGVWTKDGDYVRGYGKNVTAATKFRGAQTTQPFLCALLLDLSAKDKFPLDRKVSKDLTRQVGIDDITYAQLCNLRSGLGDYKPNIREYFSNNPTRLWAEQELLANGLENSPQSWPGLDVHWADTNAILLDRALRVKTGESTADLLSKHVFEPSGMSSSSFPSDYSNTEIPGGSMTPLTYRMDDKTPVCETGVETLKSLSTSAVRGAGASLTTVTDIKTFLDNYLSGKFGDEELSKQVFADTAPSKNPKRDEEGNPTEELSTEGTQVGFGVEHFGPMIGRNGAMVGSLTAAYTDPKSGLTVVVALNNGSASSGLAKALAFQITALTGAEVPWTADEQAAAVAKAGICQDAPAA